jgi:hypothetical protein
MSKVHIGYNISCQKGVVVGVWVVLEDYVVLRIDGFSVLPEFEL